MTDWKYHDPEDAWREAILKESAELQRAEKEKKPGPKAVRAKGYRDKKRKRRKMAGKSKRRNRKKRS